MFRRSGAKVCTPLVGLLIAAGTGVTFWPAEGDSGIEAIVGACPPNLDKRLLANVELPEAELGWVLL